MFISFPHALFTRSARAVQHQLCIEIAFHFNPHLNKSANYINGDINSQLEETDIVYQRVFHFLCFCASKSLRRSKGIDGRIIAQIIYRRLGLAALAFDVSTQSDCETLVTNLL